MDSRRRTRFRIVPDRSTVPHRSPFEPGVMLLKIYPDVRVQMYLEARAESAEMPDEEMT